ncbi:MAG: DUF2306 domain-containing protein [Lacipirellulaceae bacterium]
MASNLALVVKLLACLLILKTVAVVLANFPDYFPPDFRSDFLLGREEYFFSWYRCAFYVHILSGPFTLIAGLFLLSETMRKRFPKWHRRVGRVQVATILLLLTPSGLAMAWHAATGRIATCGFAVLAVFTAICVLQGWRNAVQQRFQHHRQWMLRCYVLLCSAVVLRVIGGISQTYGIEWTYSYAAWVSWLVPIAILEILFRASPATPRQTT